MVKQLSSDFNLLGTVSLFLTDRPIDFSLLHVHDDKHLDSAEQL